MRRTFSLTTLLVGLVSAAWVIALVAGWQRDVAVLGGIIPGRLSGGVTMAGAVPAWLTPISACFIHSDALHLIVNMVMFGFCGRQVEPAIGKGLLALVLVVGAYAAAIAETLWAPSSTVVIIGASGAVSALVGMYALVFSTQEVRAIGPIPSYVVRIAWLAAAWIGVQALIGVGFGGQIAILAHIGGFIAGLLLARPLLRWRFARRGNPAA